MHSTLTQPLAGVTVIDFTQVMMGPCCTQILADHGARVIKIERPKHGDLSRGSRPNDPEGANNPVFKSLNRNKLSLAVDLGCESGRKIIDDLVRQADVVVSNFRPGVIERLGYGYERISALNPRIISAEGSGFGPGKPLSHKGGQDVLAQAMTGGIARRSDDSHPSTVYPLAIADYSAGMHLVQAILMALLQRAQTGRGQSVFVSLFESMLNLQIQEAAVLLQRGEDLNWAAYPLTGVFPTADGAVVIVGAFKANPLRDICKAFDMQDLSLLREYSDFHAMKQNRSALQGEIGRRLRELPTDEAIGRLEGQDILCAPVLTLAQALQHPQTIENSTVVETPSGRLIGAPFRMEEGSFAVSRGAPRLGEHSASILAEIGYSNEKIRQLLDEGIVEGPEVGEQPSRRAG